MIGLESYVARQDFLGIMEAISTAESVENLIEIGRNFAAYEYGFYQHIPDLGAQDYKIHARFWARGISDEVLGYFEEKNDKTEPVMQYILAQGRPFWLSDIRGKDEFANGRNKHRVDLAMEYVGDSLLVPLFGPFSKRGYLFVGFKHPREFYDEIFAWQIHGILQAVHTRYCIIIESLRTHVKLTKRETEVLELLTLGKTNPDIGVILGISTSTVTGHVKSLFLKFNASDRVTVALRARNLSP